MKKLLLTGGTGFVGRNILPILSEKYEVLAPRRSEMDINLVDSVDQYLAENKVDYVVHCAICTPWNHLDDNVPVLDSTLRSFLNFQRHADEFEKLIFIGSGAEFDKSADIVDATEDDFGKRVPLDEYGLAKYTLTQIARTSKNIYNARIFSCYGPNEQDRRFIRHAIECCLSHQNITIRQDCRFSFVFVDDLGRAIMHLLESDPVYHDYTIAGGRPYFLSEVAEIVRRMMNSDVGIEILKPGLNNEYTGKSERFLKEFPDFRFVSLEAGIDPEIAWRKETFK